MFVVNSGSYGPKDYVTPDADKAEELFRIKYKYAVTHANGMERLAFAVLPYSLLRSFALTFDPLERFRLSAGRVTPVNRTRTRHVQAFVPARVLKGNDSFYSVTQNPNTYTCTWVPASQTSTNTPVSMALTEGPKLTQVSRDTTKRSRPVNSDMGEFESFTFETSIPERTVSRVDTYSQQGSTDTCALIGYQNQRTQNYRATAGGAAYITTANVATLRADTISRTNTALTNQLTKSLVNLLASSRRYSLARNVIELKDLPRSVLTLATTLRDLQSVYRAMPRGTSERVFAAKARKDVPNEWLSFWFGWRQTYKAIVDLVESPQQIAKDINFLISRKGLPTTVRRSVRLAGGTSTTPAFTFNPSSIYGSGWTDIVEKTETMNRWDHEVKVVLNLTFDFPEVGVPKLRRDLFLRKMGFVLTPTDLYNLVPWTWLVDWFTGLGNYVELIDNINTDKSLINWGVATCITTGVLTTEATCKFDNRYRTSYRHNFDTPITTEQLVPVRRVIPAILRYKCVSRKEIGSGFGVKSTLKPEELSSYQQSIIGAILAQRAQKRG